MNVVRPTLAPRPSGYRQAPPCRRSRIRIARRQELHHTRRAVRWNAEAIEYFDLEIQRERLGAGA